MTWLRKLWKKNVYLFDLGTNTDRWPAPKEIRSRLDHTLIIRVTWFWSGVVKKLCVCFQLNAVVLIEKCRCSKTCVCNLENSWPPLLEMKIRGCWPLRAILKDANNLLTVISIMELVECSSWELRDCSVGLIRSNQIFDILLWKKYQMRFWCLVMRIENLFRGHFSSK